MKRSLFLWSACLVMTSLVIYEESFLDQLTKKFEAYKEKNATVKVHLFFNQEKYAPGDTAFYQAHFLTEDLRPVGGRQILNLDVVNAEGVVVQQHFLRVNNGTGSNQLVFSNSLAPGLYHVMAYNDWMRNFNPGFYFQKEIMIAGQKEMTAPPRQEGVTFYPEGGHLAAGVSNKVVVRASGSSAFQILDNEQREVARGTTDSLGLGFFIFVPEAHKSYSTQAFGSTWNLPVPGTEDLALMLTPADDRSPVKIMISAPPNASPRQEELSLLVMSQGNIFYTASLRLGEKEFVQALVPQKELPPGVAVAFVFNSRGSVLAERPFFVSPPETARGTVSFDRALYHPREKVTAEISLADESGNPLQGTFAITAVNKNLFPDLSAPSLPEQLWIGSHFTASADRIPSLAGANWFATLDRYLITKKWERYDWAAILSSAAAVKKFDFKNTQQIEGTALDKNTGKPVPDSTLIMVYLQHHMMGYETYTTTGGAFELPFLFDFWGADRIFYLMEQKKKELPDTELVLQEQPQAYTKFTAAQETEKTDAYGDFRLKTNLIDRSYGFFTGAGAGTKTKAADANADFEDEVTGADVSVNVEDYIVFPTMEDLIREVIPSLQFKKIGGKPAVRVFLSEANINPNQGDPLYIIDGVMTKNTAYFLSLKPADILSVKIVKDVSKLNRFGAMGKNGMVLVLTRKADPHLVEEGAHLPVQGLSKPVSFHVTDYSPKTIANARIPDFRSTLFWNPAVRTEKNGKAILDFYLSDDVGPVQIRLEGFTADGRPFSKEAQIEVAFEARN